MFHAGSGTSGYEVAFVESVNESVCVLACLTPRGEPDGRMVVPLEDITAIERGDAYTRKVQCLHSFRGKVFRDGFSGEDEDEQIDLLEHAHATGDVATLIDLNGNAFTGFVRELGNDYAEVELLNGYGSPDGIVLVQRNGVRRVEVGRREEQARSFLYQVDHRLKRMLEP